MLSKRNLFIVDGFPKTLENINFFKVELKYSLNIIGCIYLKCGNDTLMKRNLTEKEESIQDRIHEFEVNSLPILNFFKEDGLLYEYNHEIAIDSMGKRH